MRSAECKKLQCYKCVTAQCVLLKKHPNVVQIENTQLGSHVHRWDWMNECPSWSSTSNNVCAMKCARICSISFNCKITIKWNIHNCFQNPLFFDILFFASLRMNCFCSFYGGAFFFLHFPSSLECMTHFQWAHKKEFNVLTCSLYLANWKFIQIFEKRTQSKMYLWGSRICVYSNLYRNKIDCDDHTTIDPQFIHLNIYWIGNWSSF